MNDTSALYVEDPDLLGKVGRAWSLGKAGYQATCPRCSGSLWLCEKNGTWRMECVGDAVLRTPPCKPEVLRPAFPDVAAGTKPAVTAKDRPKPKDGGAALFRRWTPSELLEADLTLRWQVQGLIAAPTFGMLGAPRKTLKSYVSICIGVGLASGRPVFDRFEVPEAKPVLYLVGEGGRIPFTRRLARVAARYGVDLREVPFAPIFDVASIGSEVFQNSLEHHLEDFRPGLVILDPYYAFHGSEKDYRNLHDEGEQLTYLSSTCEAAGASLMVNHHFNQTGHGEGLDRLSGAGGGEWADSWWFLKHREKADVEAGQFRLGLEVGSRQWGGTEWDLDLSVGRMNEDTGEFEGALDWSINRHVQEEAKASRLDKLILSVVSDHPFEFTKTEILTKIGGKKEDAMNTFDGLHLGGQIRSEDRKRQEGERNVTRTVWGQA